jgi:hypothetical protein
VVKRKRKPGPPPAVTVSNQLGFVKDKKRAGELFNAILRGVEKANAREAREREEAANGPQQRAS